MIELELGAARIVFTTRNGGVSEGPFASRNLGRFTDDNPEAVERNLADLQSELGLQSLQLLHQMHGIAIAEADPAVVPEADGAFVAAPGVGLLVTGADCPPVVLANGSAVVAIHCGWRSVAGGIVEAAAARIGPGFSAAIGPGICKRHFEVGPEVVEAMGADGPPAAQGRQLDLAAIVRAKLTRCGAAAVEHVDRCTFCEPEEFFSHRRDGVTGRQAGVVWLT